ncbi:MAG: hypothetical protein EBR70_04835, partial [Verrucomicrobia bacterium]|nr:hypothetical protein [Verrucomicrobiota bacterium]
MTELRLAVVIWFALAGHATCLGLVALGRNPLLTQSSPNTPCPTPGPEKETPTPAPKSSSACATRCP